MQVRPFAQFQLTYRGLAMLALIALTCCRPVGAAVLTFETFPDGSPATDDGAVDFTDPYTVGGVSFTVGFDSDGNNIADTVGYLEAAGGFKDVNSTNAFLNDMLKQGGATDNRDRADAGLEARLGEFLYRTPDLAQTPANAAFIIQFDAATRPAQVSGEIWDIDGTDNLGFEQWLVQAFGATGDAIQSLQSPLGLDPTDLNSLDGLPWLWTMGPGMAIDRIEISFMGSKLDRIGLAFDNITVSSNAHMPEPSSLAVFFGLGAIGLMSHRSRRPRGT